MTLMLWHSLLALLSGHLVGLSLGATGAGGALLAVPLLVYVLGRSVPDAVAISLVIVACSAFLGALQRAWAGELRLRVALIFGVTGAPGAWVGARAHALVSDELSLLLFGLLMLLVSAHTLRSKTLESDLPAGGTEAGGVARVDLAKASGAGLLVGWLTGFFGVGGGFIIVPALVYLLGLPMRTAIGTSLLITGLMSVGGLAGHLQRGGLDAGLVALMVAGSAAGLLVGMRLGRMISSIRLAQVFASFSLFISVSLILHNGAQLMSS